MPGKPKNEGLLRKSRAISALPTLFLALRGHPVGCCPHHGCTSPAVSRRFRIIQRFDKALREPLVNTLVHADYSGRVSVLVVKEPAGFTFRNPGALRIPVEQALQGGLSDCRNRTMQQMFLMIGLGERAGSGMSRIVHGWKDLGHSLQLHEHYDPQEYTVLEMRWSDELARGSSPVSSPEGSPQALLKTEERILQTLKEAPTTTTQALADQLGISKRAVLKQVEKLKEQGRLRRVGPNKGGHWEVLP